MDFSGAVLAGGRSSRFGTNKACHVYQGKALVQHVLDSLTLASESFLISNDVYSGLGVFSYQDILESAGPLSGIHAALHYAQYDWVAVAACDLPFLTPVYWQRLAIHLASSDAVVVEREARLEPLAAFYHRRLVPHLNAYLETDKRSVHGLLETVDTTVIPFSQLDLPPSVLKNINYPADLKRS